MFSRFFEEIDSLALHEWLEKGEVRLIDVREHYEHEKEAIEGDELYPLSEFDPALIEPGNKKIVFYCRSGVRSAEAASVWSRHHGMKSYNLKGGFLAFKKGRA